MSRRVASGGQGGQCPRDLFLAPTRYFFGRKKLLFLAGKNVEICDFRQKKPSDFGEELFFLEITCFWPEKNVKISARKCLRKSAKIFAPPRSREAGDAPVSVIIVRECSTMTLNPKCQSHCRRDELSRKQLFSSWRLLMATRLV